METQQQTRVETKTTAATSVSSLVSSRPYFWWKLTQSSKRKKKNKTPAVSEKQNLVETGVIGLLPLTNDFLADPLRHGLPKQDWKNSSANWCLFKGPAHCHACKNTVALKEHTEPPRGGGGCLKSLLAILHQVLYVQIHQQDMKGVKECKLFIYQLPALLVQFYFFSLVFPFTFFLSSSQNHLAVCSSWLLSCPDKSLHFKNVGMKTF